MPDLKSGLLQRLGINSETDLTDDAVLAAVDEALAERAEATATPTTPTQAVPEGMVLVDRAALEQLQSDGAAGRTARNEQLAAQRAQIVQFAIDEGRILPSQKADWTARLEQDQAGFEPVLAALPKGLLNLEEHGYSTGQDEGDATQSIDDVRQSAAYQNWSI